MFELAGDRFFGPGKQQKKIALKLYEQVADLPIISPHGHVNPRMFADPGYSFGTPVDLFIVPDHYIFRMLYSQGIPMESLGIPRKDGGPSEQDHRRIWQLFAENFYLFRGTPSGLWLTSELVDTFHVGEKLTGETAQAIYDEIVEKLASPKYTPRRLFEKFKIEVLCTTDSATDTLEHHATIRESGWTGRILPTFRPDQVVNLATPGWRAHIERLRQVSQIDIGDYRGFIQALENRRTFFKTMGAKATDHAAVSPYTVELSPGEADAIFRNALKGRITAEEARSFTGHMLIEMARMSTEDGLVMQFHPGSFRNHDQATFETFGPDMGADIPLQTEYTRNLRSLLNKYGSHPQLTLILFTLDESTYSRELATLAGHYPALKLGPPWWFHDSLNGIQRYFDSVMETAGLYNTVGFNDDTRAFCSIPARHDLWRRASANWVAGLVERQIVDMDDANELILDLAYRLAKRAYRLDEA
jgi:glucuronate isomerase